MKKDNLEKFVEAHRLEWDDKKAPAHLWEKVDKEINQKYSSQINIWKVVALGLMAAIVLISIWFFITERSSLETQFQTPELEFAELEDFKETEHFYLTSINVNYEKLSNYGIDATLEQEMYLLDENYKELIEEYKVAQGAYKEQVLRAIIQNYKTKLQILEHVLFDLERNNRSRHEKIL